MARDDAHCVLHTHTLAGMAVAACEGGLLQLNQISTEFHERVGVHAYEGVAFDLDEMPRWCTAAAANASSSQICCRRWTTGICAARCPTCSRKSRCRPKARCGRTPRVVVTPHMAASAEPAVIVDQILDSVQRVRRGLPPLNQVDRAAGY